MSLLAKKSTSVTCGSSPANSYGHQIAGSEPQSGHFPRFQRAERLTGSNQAVCTTEAEYKADKLNRTEQVKLQNFKYRVSKAEEIKRRQFQHTENVLRVKSAKFATKLRDIEDSSTLSNQKLSANKSLPARRKPDDCEPGLSRCNTCVQLKTVIDIYEKEGRQRGVLDNVKMHSTCMFSNGQINTFLKMLEAKYLEEIPGLKFKLRDCEATSVFMQARDEPRITRRQVDSSLELRDVQGRIKRFCGDLERFNKKHGGVSESIRESVERIRLSNAVVKREDTLPKPLGMTEEVRRIFKM